MQRKGLLKPNGDEHKRRQKKAPPPPPPPPFDGEEAEVEHGPSIRPGAKTTTTRQFGLLPNTTEPPSKSIGQKQFDAEEAQKEPMTVAQVSGKATTRTAAASRETPICTRGTSPGLEEKAEEVAPTRLSYADDGYGPDPGAERVGGFGSTTRANDDDTVIIGGGPSTDNDPVGHSFANVVARAHFLEDPDVIAVEVGTDQSGELLQRLDHSETSKRRLVWVGLCIVLSLVASLVGLVTYFVAIRESGDDSTAGSTLATTLPLATPTWAPTTTAPTTTAPTTTAPTTTAPYGEYAQQFVRAVGNDVDVVGTPAYMAADWIMTKDPMNLPPDAPNLIQRFILAIFYFSTSLGNGGWRSCGPPRQSEGDDCIFQSIQRLDNDTQVYKPKPATRWLSGTHECEWVGNRCDDLREPAAIEVWGQNLTGTIPTVLTELSLLQSISLAYNDFTGQIPSEFAAMRHLINLELHGNHLTGPIPEEYWGTETLRAFNVGENKLNGTLSPDVARLTDLRGLHIFENEFTGSFPVNVTSLKFLAYMRLDNNKFTGTFHTEFGKLTLLQELWYHKNNFDGTIPSEIGNMKSMSDLRIHNNKLEGTIPEEIYRLTGLFRLDVYNLNIGGTLSTAIGNLGKLEQLRLRGTSITGTVPTEMGLCTRLRLAWMHKSQFSGSMPSSVCNLRGNVGSGKLEVLQTDCYGPSPAFECNCCTSCCERGGSCALTDQQE